MVPAMLVGLLTWSISGLINTSTAQMAYIIPQRAVGFASQRCFMLTLCCCHTIQARLHKAEI